MQLKKKVYLVVLAIFGLVIVGCTFHYLEHKDDAAEAVSLANMTSCSDSENIKALVSRIHTDLKKETDLGLQSQILEAGHSYDTIRLEHIFNTLKVTAFNIRQQDQTTSDGSLSCVVSIRIKPTHDVFDDADKSLRASGATASDANADCGDCDDKSYQTLERQAMDSGFNYDGQSVISDDIHYTLQKDSNDDVVMSFSSSNGLMEFVKGAIVSALDLPNVMAQAAVDKQNTDAQTAETNQKVTLAQQSMDLRLKEVNATNETANNQLNTLWQAAGVAVTQSLLDEQRDWLKKRDVDCQIKADQDWYQLKDDEKQSYNLDHASWSPLMVSTDKEIRRVICVAKRTNDRIAPLTQEIKVVHDRLLVAQTTAAPSKPQP